MNEKQKTCLDYCHTSEECIFCDETHKKDIQNCPCEQNCEGLKNVYFRYKIKHFYLAGCPCEEFDCAVLDDFAQSCKDISSNENYQKCAQEQKAKFDECFEKCENPTCILECTAQLDDAIRNCPCAENCPCKFKIYRI